MVGERMSTAYVTSRSKVAGGSPSESTDQIHHHMAHLGPIVQYTIQFFHNSKLGNLLQGLVLFQFPMGILSSNLQEDEKGSGIQIGVGGGHQNKSELPQQ